MSKADEANADYQMRRSARHDDQAENAARYKWMLANPRAAQHLLFMLVISPNQKADFNAMIDRIIASEAGAV